MAEYVIRTGLIFRDPLSGTEYEVLRCARDQGAAWLVPQGRLPARVSCPGMHFDSGKAPLRRTEKHALIELSEAVERNLMDVDEQCVGIELRDLVAVLFHGRSTILKHKAVGAAR